MSDDRTWDQNLQKWVSHQNGQTVYWDEASQTWQPLNAAASMTPQQVAQGKGCVITLAVLVVLGLAFWAWSSFFATTEPGKDIQSESYATCSFELKDYFKTPSTVDVPWTSPGTYDASANEWKFLIPVTAENSFGGKVDSNVVCVASGTVLKSIVIDDKQVYPFKP